MFMVIDNESYYFSIFSGEVTFYNTTRFINDYRLAHRRLWTPLHLLVMVSSTVFSDQLLYNERDAGNYVAHENQITLARRSQ